MNALVDRLGWKLAVALAWLWACVHLSAEWSANEQYRFGFGVPFLAAWMAWRRSSGPIAPGRVSVAFVVTLVTALLALGLGTLLHWHDPLWRFTGAVLAFGATLLTCAWFFRVGGAPLLRREAFPLCFVLLAVPWPVPVENWVVVRLTGFVTDAATTIVNQLGVAALQRGNIIELSHDFVGLDDACSGIQSLQAMLMASLFLGEVFSLSVMRRTTLVVAGAVVSCVTNCLRIVALTIITDAHGKVVADGWHDFVGGAATILALGFLLGVSLMISWRSSHDALLAECEWSSAGREGRIVFAAVALTPLLGWLWASIVVPTSSEPVTRMQWTLNGRSLPQGWDAAPVAPSPAVRSSLRFAQWQSFHVRNPQGAVAQVIRLAWNRGERLPSLVTTHTPAVCMPSAGWRSAGPASEFALDVGGAELPCIAYPFEREGERLLVLQSQIAEGRPDLRRIAPAEIPGGFRRLATLWRAPLQQITEELLLYIPDPGDPEQRKIVASEFLGSVLAEKSPSVANRLGAL